MNAKYNSRFVLTIALVLFSTLPLLAATTGSLSLSGVVAPSLSITISPDANATNLPVGTTVSGLKIGSVNELTNNKAGYTVTLSSGNGGYLREVNAGNVASGLTDSLHYTLSYNDNTFDLANGTATISNVSQRTTGGGTTNSLYISFGAQDLNADTYSDTLTFTIAAK